MKLAELEGLPASQQKVTLRGKALEDDQPLSSYQLSDKALLMLIRVAGKDSGTAAVASAAAPSSSSSSSEKKSEAAPAVRKLCVGGCGFYGSAEQDDMCSKCYKQMEQKKKETAATEALKAEAEKKKLTAVPEQVIVVEQTDFEKCWCCEKKIGLLGFGCKCGYKFCGLHRVPETHHCQIDYKRTDRKKLEAANPKLESQKLNKI